MEFRTNVLRDGHWVIETVNFQDALGASPAPQRASKPLPDPPSCGILSRTIIPSPIVHWVLPVRLRSKEHNDIAFIGDHFVQISELQGDGQIYDVIRTGGFRFKIRNAIVVGDSLEHGLDDMDPGNTILSESRSSFSPSSAAGSGGIRSRNLPPQLLVLMLESGHLFFIFVRERSDGLPEFVFNRCESPAAIPHLGYHLASDPSSRYIIAASPDGAMVVFELKAMSVLEDEYLRQNHISPISSIRVRAIHGVIHKLVFLFPPCESINRIMLIMIVIRNEAHNDAPVSRMIKYEWEVGENLQEVFETEQKGHRLPKEHQMPMLLIPIRFNQAFLAVSSQRIGVVTHFHLPRHKFDSLPIDSAPPTELHYGAHNPLWTAWARPFRRKKYFEKTDIIYLAREDGAVIHLEIDANEMIPSVTSVGCLQTNIDTAFTTAYDIFSDVLIIGGDSGPGGIWKLAPRSELELVGTLPNWCPVVDIAVSDEILAGNPSTADASSIPARHRAQSMGQRRPSNIFSASGRGLRGNITHWRWGYQARIGLDIEVGDTVRQAWAFTVDRHRGRGLLGLLALPHSSIVLQFSDDLGHVETLPPDDTPFDTSTRTLHAVELSDFIIQVTETSITLIRSTESSRCLLEEALDSAGAVATHASSASDNIIALSTQINHQSRLHLIRAQGIELSRSCSWDAKGEVTGLSTITVSANPFVVVASMHDGIPWVTIYSLAGSIIAQRPVMIDRGAATAEKPVDLEPLTSIVVIHQSLKEVCLVIGSRCGRLLIARIAEDVDEKMVWSWSDEIVGMTRVDVFPTSSGSDDDPAIVVCCDNNLILMTHLLPQQCQFLTRYYVWPTDSNDASLPSPPIHSVYRIPLDLSRNRGDKSFMMLSGSRLLLATIGPSVSLVPRALPLHGTPTRIIYSPTLKCLVAALLDGDRPTLAFVEVETGEIISVPTDKDAKQLRYISGLGSPGDRIYGLHEWRFVKDGKTFSFILVTTKDGKLIVVSTEKMDKRTTTGRRIRFWTRYKMDLKKPVYSVVGDAEGLLYCVDRTLHWSVLDVAEKKLKPMRECKLDSPAIALRVANGKVFALTTMHSLEVIDHPGVEGSTMTLLHPDRVSRRAIHMIGIGDSADELGRCPLTLVSDQRGGIVGLRIPWGQRNKEFEVVFEGTLPSSVRRFARGHFRPSWRYSATQPLYGTLPSTADGADIIGIAMDGSMQRFALLSLELWRLLSLIQRLALGCDKLDPWIFHPRSGDKMDEQNLEPQPHPKSMHIDGDYLSNVVSLGVFPLLVGTGKAAALFCKYLDGLENGRYTNTIRDLEDAERQVAYVALGEEILKYLLRPEI